MDLGKNIIIGILIGIVLAVFIGYGVDVLYAKDCRSTCDVNNLTSVRNDVVPKDPAYLGPPVEYNQTAWDELYACQGGCDKNVAWIVFVIGLIIISLGWFYLTEPSISWGALIGGGGLVIYGISRGWGNMSDVMRLVSIGLVLAYLVFLGWFKRR